MMKKISLYFLHFSMIKRLFRVEIWGVVGRSAHFGFQFRFSILAEEVRFEFTIQFPAYGFFRQRRIRLWRTSSYPKRKGRDSNSREDFSPTGFRDLRLQPLGHSSIKIYIRGKSEK